MAAPVSGCVGPTSGQRTRVGRSATPPARSPSTRRGARHGAARAPPACRPGRRRRGGRWRRPPGAGRRGPPPAPARRSASIASAAASTSAADAPTPTRHPPAAAARAGTGGGPARAHWRWRRARRWPGGGSPASCQRSNAARAALRRCWWASSSRWCCRRAPLALAAAVVVARQLVEELGAVDQQAELEHEELGPLLVGEQHADGLVLLHHRLELADRGRVVDHEARAHRLGQLDHLPEVGGGAGEDRQAPRGAAGRCRPSRTPRSGAGRRARSGGRWLVVVRRGARHPARARRPGGARGAARRRRGSTR